VSTKFPLVACGVLEYHHWRIPALMPQRPTRMSELESQRTKEFAQWQERAGDEMMMAELRQRMPNLFDAIDHRLVPSTPVVEDTSVIRTCRCGHETADV